MVKYNVFCIGCGGTGSFFIKEFSRFMASYKNAEKEIRLVVIDGDKVEHNNLERQAFWEEDIASFKSNALVKAIKESFNLNKIYSYPIYLDRESELSSIINSVLSESRKDTPYYSIDTRIVNILIGAVDNHRARQVIHDYFNKQNTLFYYDSANEYSNGEIVFACKYEGKIIAPPRSYYFPNILKDRSKRASEQSCGTINISSPQHIVTNMLAANILLGKTIPLITDNKISLGIAYFDAFESFSTFYPFTEQYKEGEESEEFNKDEKNN